MNVKREESSLESLKLYIESNLVSEKEINEKMTTLSSVGTEQNVGSKLFLSHDCQDSNDFTHCSFLLRKSWSKVVRALQETDRDQQIEIDFSKGFFIDDKLQLGCLGISDMHHVFWPIMLMVCNSENTQTAAAIIRQSVRSFEQCGVTNIKYILKDGGTALKSAQELINTERLLCGKSELNGKKCMAHLFRSGFTRGGGYQ